MDIKPLIPFKNAQKCVSPLEKDLQQEKIREVAIEFEAIFIKQMLDAMRKTLNKEKLLDGGMAEDIFEDMLYQERALCIAKTGSFGLAKTLCHQLNQIQSLKERN